MNSLLQLDAEKCAHRTLLKIPAVSEDAGLKQDSEIKHYLVSLFIQATSADAVEMNIINVKSIDEHYTCEIKHADFEIIKKTQNLLFGFHEFVDRIKALLIQCENDNIKIKLIVSQNIELVFFTTSDVRELVILAVPFSRISEPRMIDYLLRSNNFYEEQFKIHLERANNFQERLVGETAKYQGALDALKDTYEEVNKFKHKYTANEKESRRLRNVLNEINAKNKSLENDLHIAKKQISDLNSTIGKLRADIESLKIGIEYYMLKNNHLQTTLTEKGKTMVPLEKYEKLSSMFSSIMADLLKYQTKAKYILKQNECQKSENVALKEELKNCISLINDLEEKLQKFDLSSKEQEGVDVVTEMIAKLETKASIEPNSQE